MATLIVNKDRKEAVTNKEFNIILNIFKGFTEVLTYGADYKYDEDKKVYFYYMRIKLFKHYPVVIGSIHTMYGRKIDIRTFYLDREKDTIDVYIRGYAKEIKNGKGI